MISIVADTNRDMFVIIDGFTRGKLSTLWVFESFPLEKPIYNEIFDSVYDRTIRVIVA